MRRSLSLLLALSAGLLAGCPQSSKVDMCGPDVEKRGLADLLYSWYLYPDLLPPVVDTSQYGTSQELLDAMTKAARDVGQDRGWTYVTTAAQSTTFFEEGKAVGIGIGLLARAPDVFVSQVYPGSPAEAAGFHRGDKLLQIGETEATLQAVTPDNVGSLVGPATAGLSRVFEVLPAGGGSPVVRTATKATFDLDPVPAVQGESGRRWRIVDRPASGKKLGYVALRSFIAPADAQLTEAFQAFRAAGVTDVVVDLRYNGGGLVQTAGLLANLLGGGLAGQPMVQSTYNARRAGQDTVDRFGTAPSGGSYADVPGAIATTHVAFITTGASASASELVPNVLEPYKGGPSGPPGTALGLVGAKTYGKPVGQHGFRLNNCDTVAYVVAFRIQNAQGDGAYYDGLPDAAGNFSGPLCAAEDDLANAPGTDAEASTAAALAFAETGACPAPAAPAAKPGAALSAARPPDVYPEAPEPSLAQRHVNGLF